MNAPQFCYFLVYRTIEFGHIDWNHPTGGLVMEPIKIIDGIPLSDHVLAEDVAKQRYHVDPWEYLMLAEVFQPREKCLAAKLHNQWEREAEEFHALMTIG